MKERVEKEGLALYLAKWLALCEVQIAIFKVGASLKLMPGQSKLKLGICITIRNANCQGLNYKQV